MKTLKFKLIIGLACALVLSFSMFSAEPKDYECKDCNGFDYTCSGGERCDGANAHECYNYCDFRCGWDGLGWGEMHHCTRQW